MQDKPTRKIVRVKVAPGIWKRTGADGRERFEITYRDSDGKQRCLGRERGCAARPTLLNEQTVPTSYLKGKRSTRNCRRHRPLRARGSTVAALATARINLPPPCFLARPVQRSCFLGYTRGSWLREISTAVLPSLKRGYGDRSNFM